MAAFESTLSRIVEMFPALPPCTGTGTGSLARRGEKRADSQTTDSSPKLANFKTQLRRPTKVQEAGVG
jgi:hypothetical protein